jgi:hypothetical protein
MSNGWHAPPTPIRGEQVISGVAGRSIRAIASAHGRRTDVAGWGAFEVLVLRAVESDCAAGIPT